LYVKRRRRRSVGGKPGKTKTQEAKMVTGTPEAVPKNRGANEEGQALVEYALILGLVSLVAIGTLTLMGQSVLNAMLEAVAQALANAIPGG
jgi:Flp pilus assembly pilin Flp